LIAHELQEDTKMVQKYVTQRLMSSDVDLSETF